jgi:hypothetical protein
MQGDLLTEPDAVRLQFCVSASTASELGFQNKELNLLIFLLTTLANLSTE